MTRRNSARLVLPLLSAILVSAIAPLSAEPAGLGDRSSSTGLRRQLARTILSNPRITLLDYHVSRNSDRATALDNIIQTASGYAARRSYYGNGPGGSTPLDVRMLRAIEQLTREGWSFRITELAGGSHSSRSRHYVGVAFDIDFLNGHKVKPGHPTYRRFMKRCRELGATEVLGPGTRGHSTHVHIAWPRPKY